MPWLSVAIRLVLSLSLVLNGLAAATMLAGDAGASYRDAVVSVATAPVSKGHCRDAPDAASAVASEQARNPAQGCHPGMGCACDCAHLVAPAMTVLVLPHPVIDAAPMPTLRLTAHRSAIHSPLIRPPIA